jgi:hypothetical protein
MFQKKILTEILSPLGSTKRVFQTEDNKIIIRPSTDKTEGYKAGFTRECLIPYRTFFGLVQRQKLLLIDGADECIKFKYEEDKTSIDAPIWNRKMEEKLFKANVIKAAGSISQKIEVPMLLYLAMFGCMILSVVTVLVVSGRLKL